MLGLLRASSDNKLATPTDDVQLTYQLDSLGAVQASTSNRMPRSIAYTRDALGRATSIAAGSQTIHRTDKAGHVTAVPEGTTFDYDGLGRTVGITVPGKGRIELLFDAFGRLTEWTGAAGVSGATVEYGDTSILRQVEGTTERVKHGSLVVLDGHHRAVAGAAARRQVAVQSVGRVDTEPAGWSIESFARQVKGILRW